VPAPGLLAEIEAYYDAAPRAAARVEAMGPFVVFVPLGASWPYYARPALGAGDFTAADVRRVLDRQQQLGVPQAFEWVAETTPALRPAVERAGLAVAAYPLLVLQDEGPSPVPRPADIQLRLASPEDDLALFGAVAQLAFASGGTAPGPQGPAGPADLAPLAGRRAPAAVAFERERVRTGRTVMAVALAAGTPVGVGSHQPVGRISEVVGLGTLPAYRRRGIGGALTAMLAADARGRGVETVFLSAGDSDVARVYQRVGFRHAGTACAAAPPTA
jgi:ribosomal protein S18 acetylase RimI-like enzyme